MLITNEHAAQQARDLSLDYERHVLDAFGALPRISSDLLRQLLDGVHLSVNPVRTGFNPNTHESVAITCSDKDVPNDETGTALTQFSSNRSERLGAGFTFDAIEQPGHGNRTEFEERRAHLNRPLGILGQVGRAPRKRRVGLTALLAEALAVFQVVPVAPELFEKVFVRVLKSAGFQEGVDGYTLLNESKLKKFDAITFADFGDVKLDREAMQQQAQANHAKLDTRWQTILAWTFDAVSNDGSSPAAEVSLVPFKKYERGIEQRREQDEGLDKKRQAEVESVLEEDNRRSLLRIALYKQEEDERMRRVVAQHRRPKSRTLDSDKYVKGDDYQLG